MTDWITIIVSITSSAGITTAGAWWFGKSWFTHRLNSELEKLKGNIRKDVENELADAAAQREYEFTAKQRLYSVIGPLKFQLLIACRDLSKHIRAHGVENVQYSLEPTNYYGKSTIYRIIVPFVFVELIERKLAIADFSVDSEAVELLRFKKNAYRACKSDKTILNHPAEHWQEQKQHLFHHTISKIVDSFIVSDPASEPRPMYFNEFEAFLLDLERRQPITPLIQIIRDFSLEQKPIFWVRLVFLAYICSNLVNHLGKQIGFNRIDIDIKSLLTLSKDNYVLNNVDRYVEKFKDLASEGL